MTSLHITVPATLMHAMQREANESGASVDSIVVDALARRYRRVLHPQQRGPKPLGLDESAIVRAYEAGESAATIAARHDCSDSHVRNVLKRAGVAMRPRGPRKSEASCNP